MELLPPPLVVSGDTPDALAAAALRLRQDVESTPGEAVTDLAHRLLTAPHARCRGAVLARERSALLAGLTVLAGGGAARNVLRGTADIAREPVLVFPGQGPHWSGMVDELLTSLPLFRDRVDHYGRILAPRLGWDPAAALAAGGQLGGLGAVQPVQFALSSALADLWQDCGLHASAVVGHSVGEIAAALAAGVLGTDGAAEILVLHGSALGRIEGRGAMASIVASAERVAPLLEQWGGRLDLAAVNSDRNTTVSGDTEAIDELLDRLKADGTWAWRVPGVDVAGHSRQVEAVKDFVLDGTPDAPAHRAHRAHTAFYSTVTGTRLDTVGLGTTHWYRGLRDTVLFERAVRALVADGHRLFVEASAHPTLTTVIGETLRSAGVVGAVLPTLDRRKGDSESLLKALTHAFVCGSPITWSTTYGRLITPPRAEAVLQHTSEPHASTDRPSGERRGVSARRETAPSQAPLLATALAGLSASEQTTRLVELVSGETTAALGRTFAAATETFLDIGFSSLGVVELAAALSAATGLDLPATLLFDHPTPIALATHLCHALGLAPAEPTATSPIARVGTGEPIAIVGIGCRFPGGANSAESLWNLVAEGRDVVGEYPTDRGWDTENLYDPVPGRLGRIASRAGGFLYDAADFDAGFFGLSPREATAMEPQQRLLLEVSWEALEHAGIVPDSLRGTRTGVFAGMIGQEYGPRLHLASDDVAGHAFLGTAACVASGRVAYVLGLEGPAITLDTACSSSLVAIHQACQALRDDDCRLALAGGATVMSGPGSLVEFSRQQVLSPDGRCKPFSAAADGITLSEGVGMVVLERLSDAQANKHPVLAVIRGSAVNQDGASNGLTAPSGSAQQRVIRQALAHAGLTPQDIDVIEAHGTGTRLGDPVEAHALLATYGQGRPAERPVWLGSVKSNMGHTQAAAGVAGLIKMVMALRHGLLPESLHIDAPSPHVDWSGGNIRLLGEQQPWPEQDGRTRRAAVSSFGVSGTNSHLIVEQPPDPAPTGGSASAPGQVLWPLSAKTPTALRTQAARLRRYVMSHPGPAPAAVGHALATTRGRFAQRAVVRGRSEEELTEGLHALAEGRDHPHLVRGAVPQQGPGKLVLVFPGQGTHWPGMGLELYDTFPTYREALDDADSALRPFTHWSVIDVLRGAPDVPALEGVEVVHPASFAVMVSLARLWQSFGLEPDAVLGHSQGEIAAAHIAGALALDDAARWVVLRSRALTALAGTGAMATLGMSADRTRALLDALDGRITVAALNSPASTVVAGDPAAVTELLRRCAQDGVRTRRIDVDVPGHSPYIDPLHDDVLDTLAHLTTHPTTIAFHSTVEGRPHDTPLDGRALDATYWYDNLRNPVALADTVRTLEEQGHRTFLECGPHPVLSPPLQETLGPHTLVAGTLRRGRPQPAAFADATARLYVHGHSVTLNPTSTEHVELPSYAFEHRRYWFTPAPPTADVATAGQHTTEHPLLGAAIDLPDDEGLLLTGRVGLATHPWLADHAATSVALVPGTAYLDMALRAADLAGCAHITELTLHTPMVLPGQDSLDLRLRVGPPDALGHRPLTLHARTDTEPTTWTLHATARLTRQAPSRPPTPRTSPWPPDDAEPIDLAELRRSLAKAGYDYGPAFTGLRAAWWHDEHVYAEAELPEDLATAGHIVHPALLDTLLHPIALPRPEDEESSGPRLPFSFTGITSAAPADRSLRVYLRRTGRDTVSVLATDPTGVPVLTVDSLILRPTVGDHLRRLTGSGAEHDLLQMAWNPLSATAAAGADTTWAVLGTDPLGNAPRHAGLSDLTAAVDAGAPPPEVVVWPLPPTGSADGPDAARALCERVLDFLKDWLADDRFTHSVLAVVTRQAVATQPHEPRSLTHGPAWGLLHTAQQENPGRIVLTDTDGGPDSWAALTTVLAVGQPQSAVREGRPYIPRLARSTKAEILTPPSGTRAWRLETTGTGGIDRLALVPAPEATAALEHGQVRVDVRAAAMNFVDTAATIGLIPPQSGLGAEAAGVVAEVGPGVEGLAVGDRVTGLVQRAFGPVAVADRRLLTRFPDTWSFAQAAGVPVAFATAYHGLVDLAGVQPGETVLIHAAAGGVGQAATQLVRHLGAVPIATAHPDKWPVLRQLGYPDEHIANSRSLDFAARVRRATGGRGVDVVLNSLAGPFVDASLELLAPGGRFIELGKTDIRTTTPSHVSYRAFDLHPSAGPDRIAEILTELLRLLNAGELTPLPVTAHDIRLAPDAFRLMQQGRHTGKIVLIPPRRPDPDGTVLITGGTGTLGGLLARHLVATHGARHLLLAARSGSDAPGAAKLRADLENAGARVDIVACDVADPDQVTRLLAAVPPRHPLTAVFHTAGVLSDGTLTSLTAADLAASFGPKADGAWYLHERTRHLDLAAFVMYSSTAAVFGNPGQGNYVAANSFLDALAHQRHHQGLPATSLAWGWWQPVSGLTGALTDTDTSRIARTGLAPISAEYGHDLLDTALSLPYPVLTASPLSPRTLRDNSRHGILHPLLENLTSAGTGHRPRTAAESVPDLREDLAALTPEARLHRLRALVTAHATAVLGLDEGSPLPPDRPFKASGFDSLTALELRNRLTTATGLPLLATLTYDHPTPDALAAHLGDQLFPSIGQTDDGDARIQRVIASIPVTRLRELGLLETLLQAAEGTDRPAADTDLDTAGIDELVTLAWSAKETE